MAPKRTFIDAGVLIAAARGCEPLFSRAMAVLDDPDRAFITSDFLRLEVLPKARFHKKVLETEFYEAFFDEAACNIPASRQIVADALEEASRSGLSAMDSLHVAAAVRAGAEELVTTEKPGRTLFAARSITIMSLHCGPFLA